MRDVNFNGRNQIGDITDKSKKTIKISVSIGSAIIIIGVIAFILFRSTPIESKILGTWHSNEISDLYIVFSENNSLTVNRSGANMSGTYIFTDNDRVQLNFNFSILNYVIYADVSVQGKTLSFDNIEDLSNYFSTSDKTTFEMVK